MEILYIFIGIVIGVLIGWLFASLRSSKKLQHIHGLVSDERATNRVLSGKLDTQKKELEEFGRKFTTEFQNLPHKILTETTD